MNKDWLVLIVFALPSLAVIWALYCLTGLYYMVRDISDTLDRIEDLLTEDEAEP